MSLLSLSRKQSSAKAGLPPGTLTYIGEHREHPVNISMYAYTEEECIEIQKTESGDWKTAPKPNMVRWINIDGIHDLDVIARIGNHFELHPLIQEDIVNTTQRPKLEEYENGYYMVLKMISFKNGTKDIDTEQVSFFLGKDFVLTFQEKTEDVFGPIRERLEKGLGRLRKKKADYLFYALIDIVINNYFFVLEDLEDQINLLDESMLIDTSQEVIHQIQDLKRTVIYLRKAIYPLREVIIGLEKSKESTYMLKQTKVFLRDLQDHLTRMIELLDTFREVLTGLGDLHYALMSHQMNEVMKVLTVIAAIFIPLTFLAGIYGMNFQYIPELGWKYGYFVLLGLMAVIVFFMVYLFKRKNWL